MCGIVGFVGQEALATEAIVQGLKKLEYRGYDSAGIAVVQKGVTTRVRASGKLNQLEAKLQSNPPLGSIGIGHTRWATHGEAVERNAHPHQSGPVTIVHNGIVENDHELRKILKEQGHQFESETDSELIAHLIHSEYQRSPQLGFLSAIRRAKAKLTGAFAVAVLFEAEPNKIYAFKDGPPLILAIGENFNMLVSDVQAAIDKTKRFVYLEDSEIVEMSAKEFQISDLSGAPINGKQVVFLNWSSTDVEKNGYSHFMLKEIYEQPSQLQQVLKDYLNPQDHTLVVQDPELQKFIALAEKVERIQFVACGTSYYAALYAKYLIEDKARVTVDVDFASEFRYRNPALTPKTLLISISQSGETADTLAAVKLAKAQGLAVVSLCNVARSSIDREADVRFSMRCGPEIGVASTKALMNTLGLLHVLAHAIAMGRNPGWSLVEQQEHIKALLSLPGQVETLLNFDKYFAESATRLAKFRGFLFLGRGLSYPIALEGALKMKELTYRHAEGYASGEMKHGPLALIDKEMAIVTLVPKDHLYEKSLSNLQEAKARGGQIIALGSGIEASLRDLSDEYLSLPKSSVWTSSLLQLVPLQLMAFHLASQLGHDVDRPRNLAKSVTVE